MIFAPSDLKTTDDFVNCNLDDVFVICHDVPPYMSLGDEFDQTTTRMLVRHTPTGLWPFEVYPMKDKNRIKLIFQRLLGIPSRKMYDLRQYGIIEHAFPTSQVFGENLIGDDAVLPLFLTKAQAVYHANELTYLVKKRLEQSVPDHMTIAKITMEINFKTIKLSECHPHLIESLNLMQNYAKKTLCVSPC